MLQDPGYGIVAFVFAFARASGRGRALVEAEERGSGYYARAPQARSVRPARRGALPSRHMPAALSDRSTAEHAHRVRYARSEAAQRTAVAAALESGMAVALVARLLPWAGPGAVAQLAVALQRALGEVEDVLSSSDVVPEVRAVAVRLLVARARGLDAHDASESGRVASWARALIEGGATEALAEHADVLGAHGAAVAGYYAYAAGHTPKQWAERPAARGRLTQTGEDPGVDTRRRAHTEVLNHLAQHLVRLGPLALAAARTSASRQAVIQWLPALGWPDRVWEQLAATPGMGRAEWDGMARHLGDVRDAPHVARLMYRLLRAASRQPAGWQWDALRTAVLEGTIAGQDLSDGSRAALAAGVLHGPVTSRATVRQLLDLVHTHAPALLQTENPQALVLHPENARQLTGPEWARLLTSRERGVRLWALAARAAAGTSVGRPGARPGR